GIGEACRVLGFPVVSGNVSLYNETNGEGILPTPTIGGVGLLQNWRDMVTTAFAKEGDVILLVGDAGRHLGQSSYVLEIHGLEAGAPPPVDLHKEKQIGDFVRSLIAAGQLTACHDISNGGLLITIAEMALAGNIGAQITGVGMDAGSLFGEDQARYVVSVSPDVAETVLKLAKEQGVPATNIGRVGGTELKLGSEHAISVRSLNELHEAWLPSYMAGDNEIG
ncbi:MAG: phosphoribosylformylglycinamidine synthase II, partial [Rhizobiales bacterium]|nr:phosphoribosylformylglycinamidine synthase II [Hyphomicrobiales bacterium]